jgi:hypothetical protein
MKRYLPWLALILAVAWVAASLAPPKLQREGADLVTFGKIPVLVGGRVKPIDTVARNSLLIIHTKSTVRLANGKTLTALEWLADVLFKPAAADRYPVFVISNAEVLGLFGWEQTDRKYFSFHELQPFLKQIDEQGEQADKLESVQRSAYQTAILNLRNALILNQRLKNTLRPDDANDFTKESAIMRLQSRQPVKPQDTARKTNRSTKESSMPSPPSPSATTPSRTWLTC